MWIRKNAAEIAATEQSFSSRSGTQDKTAGATQLQILDLNVSDDCDRDHFASGSVLEWALIWLTYPAKLQKESDSGLICGAGL
jgi:hypothetical protein